ncbi:hypothetical protein ACLQ2R_14585 [Streptosporangium sp. DT93]|uniref:hypothetical protein n=1 Tax=Streptosporangium sp. DT93 TaxID=3393428 RepID=UPI003CF07793
MRLCSREDGHSHAAGRISAVIDVALVAVVASAYVLCRGWLAWRPATVDSAR